MLLKPTSGLLDMVGIYYKTFINANWKGYVVKLVQVIVQGGDVSFKGCNISSLPNPERSNKSKHSSYANLEGADSGNG